MFKNSAKLIFFFSLVLSSFVAFSSNSWLGMWMGLEINLLSFIPLMIDNNNNSMSTEATLKYFLTQALASALFLFSLIWLYQINNMNMIIEHKSNYILSLTIMPLLMKSGAAPFHFWMPNVMEGLTWMSNLILMTWQKITPLMIISYLILTDKILIISIILLSITFGSIGGLSQTSLKKIMAFSSINHIGWMLAAMLTSEILWIIYFFIYCFLSFTMIFIFNSFKLFHINQSFSKMTNKPIINFFLMMSLLSLGGLPPFLGFLPKWLVIQSMTMQNFFIVIFLMVCLTLLTLFYYLQICYSSFMFNNWEIKLNSQSFYLNTNMKMSMLLAFFSIFGLMLLNLILMTFN